MVTALPSRCQTVLTKARKTRKSSALRGLPPSPARRLVQMIRVPPNRCGSFWFNIIKKKTLQKKCLRCSSQTAPHLFHRRKVSLWAAALLWTKWRLWPKSRTSPSSSTKGRTVRWCRLFNRPPACDCERAGAYPSMMRLSGFEKRLRAKHHVDVRGHPHAGRVQHAYFRRRTLSCRQPETQVGNLSCLISGKKKKLYLYFWFVN